MGVHESGTLSLADRLHTLLREREVLRVLHRTVGHDLTLISVGGISTGSDARARLEAGATLVQAYTGFVYGGPRWPRRIAEALAHEGVPA